MAPRKTEAPDDTVVMVHPRLDAPPARVTRRQFDRIWEPRGFRIAPKETGVASSADAALSAANAELAAAVKGEPITDDTVKEA